MLAVALFAALAAAAPQAAAQRTCRALDGDTLACGSERIRVMGLDAPELHARCPAEERAALAARERLAELTAAGLTIERHGRDRYRRTLAIVRDRQGRDVARLLVSEGLARPYDGRTRRRSWCDGQLPLAPPG